MPMLPVDTAVQVIVGPLIDDTDFKSQETGVAHDAGGMSCDLLEKGENSSAKTDLTLTSGGANDWVELGSGYYSVEITAAQNNTEGTLKVAGIATGILPFESVEYDVVSGQYYNSVMGTDTLQVHVTEFDANVIDSAAIANGAIVAATFAANAITSTVVADNTITAAKINADAITAAKIADDAIAAEHLADNVIHADALSDGALADVNAEVSDVLKTDTIAEMAQSAPSATPTMEEVLNWLYRYFLNLRTQSSTEIKVYDAAGSTVITKATISDDGTTFTKAEFVTGP